MSRNRRWPATLPSLQVSDFELKLMDIDGEHLAVPETEYKCTVTMPSSDFQRICRDLATIGDTCTIAISKEGVKFSVKGDLGTGNILRKAGKHGGGKGKKGDEEGTEVKIVMDEPVELTFALRYLGFFCKAAPLSPNVVLHMSKDVPLMVEFVIEVRLGTRNSAARAAAFWRRRDRRRRRHAATPPLASPRRRKRAASASTWRRRLRTPSDARSHPRTRVDARSVERGGEGGFCCRERGFGSLSVTE